MLLRNWATFVLLSCSLIPVAFAQRDFATLAGTVTDPSGAAVPNAKITIVEDATGLSYEVTASSNGEFARPALKSGVYTITAEAAGFKKSVRKSVTLTAGDRIAIDMKMEVGEVSTTVEVGTEAPLLQTESTIIGTTLGSKQLVELPLGGQRTFTFLARLSPGVVPAEPGARDAVGGGFSANGVRSNGQNNFLLNGVDNNVNVIDFLNQTAFVIGPSVEAIGEMKVLTNGYNAEYGRGAGGVVNVILKSGTNQFHGSLFNYLQNDKVNANRWENNLNGRRRGPFKQNQYGFTIGGPVIKNRTFFFFDYQKTELRAFGGSFQNLGTAANLTIPTAAMKNGDFSHLQRGAASIAIPGGGSTLAGTLYDPNTQTGTPGNYVRLPFAGNMIPVSRFDAAAKKIIDLFPSPTRLVNGGNGFQQDNYFVTTRGSLTTPQWDFRMDHRLSDKDSIFGSLSWSNTDKFNEQPLPGALDATYFNSNIEENQSRNATVSYTRVWTPSIISETRAAVTRLVTARTQALPDVDQFAAFGIGGYNPTGPLNGGLPSTGIDRYSGFGASDWLPSKEYSNVLDFIQNLAINKGSHSIKFGAEYRPIKFPFFQFPSPHGNWNFNRIDTAFPSGVNALNNDTGDGYASFLLGRVNNAQISTTNYISSQKDAWAFFAQDDWKVNSKLTLNYGIRYEIFSPIDERFGRQSTFDFQTLTLYIPKGKDQNAPLPPNFATQFPNVKVSRGEVGSKLIGTDFTNFAPRIGISYNVANKTVLRGGYGIFYGGEENQGGNPNRGEGAPFNFTVQTNRQDNFLPNDFFAQNGNGDRGVSRGFPINVFTLPAPIQFRSVAQNFRNGLVHKWNLAVQREIGSKDAVEVSYVGNIQSRQLQNTDPNACFNDPSPNPLPCDRRRPFPNIGGVIATTSFGFGDYQGMTAKWERRFTEGLSYLVTYTLGKANSTSGTTLSGSRGAGTRDPRNYSLGYAPAAWDIRHSMVASFLYDLPFGKGKRFGSNWGSLATNVIGNWQVNGILTLRSGAPFTVRTNQCVGAFNVCTPDLVAGRDPNGAPSGGRTPSQWFDTTAVVRPAPGTPGNVPLQSNRDPGQQYMDLSLFKNVVFKERFTVQFRAEAFNLTNTPQFGQPNNTQGDPNFGRIFTTQAGTERKMQFALRFAF
jgi:hypothetical protein